MIVRFGYVAMSTLVENASPSRMMTVTNFIKLEDREAAIRKLERLALENLHNTLRLLRHNRAYQIQVYRFTSKLIPLFGHALLAEWDPFLVLAEGFSTIGEFVRDNEMRVSFHPDHFTVLSTPRPEVLENSVGDLKRHVQMLQAMGLDKQSKCNIHIGGAYGDKPSASERFAKHFLELDPTIQERITLENDDKTFTAIETLELCEKLKVPMVLDIHHYQVNNNGEVLSDLWGRIYQTWPDDLPPKIHVSSPKSIKVPRAHADYVDSILLLDFMRDIASTTPRLDVMLEAKMKDAALIQLMVDLADITGIRIIDGASLEIN
ncbi:UV DNA damage repair endonuclease UvsE [Paenibacillus psychroresistens]|uniref:UV DNA damage repair endonuclease UvsE n=1 Tax=Paenibacillus psychroresistens TaxID=1778678 RepID=A0A6B8RT10_9BACL|nr:UV DNA damage repair endonuclease UvsE [Paenibacillus psychroresistens]QGQ98583.1 UV DNA damage repair endonuclease UvsE [Paenibacillus psychroresistens]